MSHWLAEMEKPPSDVWQKVLPRVPAPGARRWHHTLLARANGRVERVCGSLTSKGGGRGASRAEGLAAQNGCPNRVSARSALVCVRDGRRLSEIRLGCSTSEGGSVRGTQHTGWPVNLLRRTPRRTSPEWRRRSEGRSLPAGSSPGSCRRPATTRAHSSRERRAEGVLS